MKKMKKLIFGELGRIIIGLSLFSVAFIFEIFTDSYPFVIASAVLYIAALLICGLPVFFEAVRGILRRDLLDEKFLMSIASVGAMIIGDMEEGVAVMLFFLIGEYFEHKAVSRSRNSIKSLMNICPDEACVIENGIEKTVDAEDVEVGSEILIKTGERVPIDSVIISGGADIDTSALTGESLPRAVGVGDSVESGCVVMNGYITCKTVRAAEESAAARILELVENASDRKSKEESFITKFSRYYTPVVVILALLMALLPPLLIDDFGWSRSVYSALTFLVISCPCALVISVPMAFFGGIGGAASRGILFKGGNVFSALSRADSVAFDKTGTLTNGKFLVRRVDAFEIDESELLYYAASAEYGSTHPLAECVKAYSKDFTEPEEYCEVAGRGIAATVKSKIVLVGCAAHLSENGISLRSSEDAGALYVAVDGVHIGTIFIQDEIKCEAENAIRDIKALGVSRVAMLSGDVKSNALTVGDALGISEVHFELRPEEKYSELESIIEKSRSTVYVGDGINDAPSLARADVGIAMGALGSDSAIEAADVVIMADDLSRIPLAIRIARKTVKIAKANIALALIVKGAILALSMFGFANMWLAVFADVGVAVIAILNSMRTLKVK